MFTDVDPANPVRAEEQDWFEPAFPHVRAIKALEKWKGGSKFKLLTHEYTTQAAVLYLQDYLLMAKDHVKRHVAQVVTNAEAENKSERTYVLTMLDLHPTGEVGEKQPAAGVLDESNAAKLRLYQSYVVKTLLSHAREICDPQTVIRLNAWRLSLPKEETPAWCAALKIVMPRRINSTEYFDMATFVVLRRKQGHEAKTWLDAVAQHKARLRADFTIPESVFVYMLLSQLTRKERMSSIDAVHDPNGVIALTWAKASDAVAGLDPANHDVFDAKMCGSPSLPYHPLKNVTHKSSVEEKEAAKAGRVPERSKNEVKPLENAERLHEFNKLKLKNEAFKAQLKNLQGKKRKRKVAPCKFHFHPKLICKRGTDCRFSHDPADKPQAMHTVSLARVKAAAKAEKKRKVAQRSDLQAALNLGRQYEASKRKESVVKAFYSSDSESE